MSKIILKFNLQFTILLLIFFACSNNNSKKSKHNIFKYNEAAGITSLDPAFTKDQANIWICNQLYNGLVQLDDKLKIKPCIAKTWNISQDGKTYQFHLRKDVFFYDHSLFSDSKGRKLTAQDFVYSLNRLTDAAVASPGAWVLNKVAKTNNKNNIKAINDSTLEIELSGIFPPFLGLLSMQYCSVVPHEIVEHYGKEFRKHPVGTGPFFLKAWKEGVKLVLNRNEKYFEKEGEKRLPYLDGVAVSFIVDKQTAFLEFVKGNIDFISGTDPAYKDEVLAKAGALNPKYENKIYLIREPYLNTEYLGFLVDENKDIVKNSPLKDKRIRQAINFSIDRKKMIKYLRNNIGIPALSGIIPAGMPAYTAYEAYNYNPAKASALLRAAGYPDGKALPEIQLMTSASYLDLCKYIQQELNEVGIRLKLEVTPAATLRQIISKSGASFFRGSWIADYPDAENYLSLFYSANFAPNGPNYTHFKNKTFDELYEKAQKEVNDSIRFSYYIAMDRIIIDEAPVVVLYYDEVLRFVQKNIKGLGINPMNLLDLKRVEKL